MSRNPLPHHRRLAALALLLAAPAVAACGSGTPAHTAPSKAPSSSSSAASSGAHAHNAQDVAFARAMIPHHRQALAMADLAPGRAKSTQVRELAARIHAAQQPEITRMSKWLRAWGEKVPSDAAPHGASPSATPGTKGMQGTDGPGGGMPGMMSEADMTKLAKTSGAAFDTAFLRMMIGHHQGAVDMAKKESAKGLYGPAKALAASVTASQSAQIHRMESMLGS